MTVTNQRSIGSSAGIMLPIGWDCRNAGHVSDQFGELLPFRKLMTTGDKVTILGVGPPGIGKEVNR